MLIPVNTQWVNIKKMSHLALFESHLAAALAQPVAEALVASVPVQSFWVWFWKQVGEPTGGTKRYLAVFIRFLLVLEPDCPPKPVKHYVWR